MALLGLVSYEVAVVLTLVAVISYLFLSGYKAVVLTDVIQGVVMLILLVVVSFGFFQQSAISYDAILAAREIDLVLVTMFLVFGAATAFAAPDRYQLTFAGKDVQSLKTGFMASFFPVMISSFVLLIIGSGMFIVNPSLDTNVVFSEAITNFVLPGLVPFALLMFFAGIMSSADTQLYVLASHVQKMRNKELTRRSMRWLLIVFGLITFAVVMQFRNIVELTIFAASLQVAVSFAMIYLVAGGSSKLTFFGMSIGGVIGVVAGAALLGISPTIAGLALLGNILGWLVSIGVKRFLA